MQYFAAQIVLALNHLHAQHFVYRDLKLENVILDARGALVSCLSDCAYRLLARVILRACQGVIRLTDFGLSHKLVGRKRVKSCSGTLIYIGTSVGAGAASRCGVTGS